MSHEHDTALLRGKVLNAAGSIRNSGERGYFNLRNGDDFEGGGDYSAKTPGKVIPRPTEVLRSVGRQGDLKENFREIKKEAKAEFKQSKSIATKMYEKSLDEAKSNYVVNAKMSREAYERSKDIARENYEKALKLAKDDYEFTVDIAKDQYKNGKYPEEVARENREAARRESQAAQRERNTAARIKYERATAGKTVRMEDDIKRMVADIEADWVDKIARDESW